MGMKSWLFRVAMEDELPFWWVVEFSGRVNTIELCILLPFLCFQSRDNPAKKSCVKSFACHILILPASVGHPNILSVPCCSMPQPTPDIQTCCTITADQCPRRSGTFARVLASMFERRLGHSSALAFIVLNRQTFKWVHLSVSVVIWDILLDSSFNVRVHLVHPAGSLFNVRDSLGHLAGFVFRCPRSFGSYIHLLWL